MMDIKGFLRKNGLKQVELARYLGVTEASVSRMAKGISNPSVENLTKILNNNLGWDTSMLQLEVDSYSQKKKIPLYEDVSTIGGYNDTVANVEDNGVVSEWIDAGDWFPNATAAVHHYGDSMIEFPAGCILALKRVNDPRLIISGEVYVIETDEFRITKQIQDRGDHFVAYSTNLEKYPDGSLVHPPLKIPKDAVRHLDLVIGCVVKRFSNGPIRIK